jgi:hypothetical protein
MKCYHYQKYLLQGNHWGSFDIETTGPEVYAESGEDY